MNTAELLNHIEDRALELAEARRDLAAMTDHAETVVVKNQLLIEQRTHYEADTASFSKDNHELRDKVARLTDQLAASEFNRETERKGAVSAANHQTEIIRNKNEEIERLNTELALARQEGKTLVVGQPERTIGGYHVNADGYAVSINDGGTGRSLRYLTPEKAHGLLDGEWIEYPLGRAALIGPRHYRPATEAEVEAAGRHPSDPKFKP